MTDNTQTKNQIKKLNRWATALGVIGFILIWGGISTEDARTELPNSRKAELASERTTLGMIGAGTLSMAAAALLLYKRNRKTR